MIDNWKRPNITSDYLKNIVPYEVGHQGVLNDGWFLGAISSLTENAEYIKRIFTTDKSLIKKGAYELNFYVRGKKQQVLIDDRFAVEGYGKYINAQPSEGGRSLYLPLIEKAYAKLNVNYEHLDNGNGKDNLLALR